MDKRCSVCDDVFHATRATAKFCSVKCRVAYNRQVDQEPYTKSAGEVDEWVNSAETKTQEEIEAHYTLANFPLVKYYSLNGGGSGAYSPYPLSNPRSAAYMIR